MSPVLLGYFGWETLFHLFGGMTILWSVPLLLLLVHDTPDRSTRSVACVNAHSSEVAHIAGGKDAVLPDIDENGMELKATTGIPWLNICKHKAVIAITCHGFAGACLFPALLR